MLTLNLEDSDPPVSTKIVLRSRGKRKEHVCHRGRDTTLKGLHSDTRTLPVSFWTSGVTRLCTVHVSDYTSVSSGPGSLGDYKHVESSTVGLYKTRPSPTILSLDVRRTRLDSLFYGCLELLLFLHVEWPSKCLTSTLS